MPLRRMRVTISTLPRFGQFCVKTFELRDSSAAVPFLLRVTLFMRVRVATFNVENLNDRPGLVPSLAERIGVLRPQLVALRADVLCLQEVHGQKIDKHLPRQLRALDELLETTEYAGFHRASTLAQDHGSIDVHNLVVLSRFPITSHEQVRHDVVRGPLYQQVTASPPAAAARVEWDRPLLVVTLDLGEEHPPLHVINVHMRAPLAALIEDRRRRSSSGRRPTVGQRATTSPR